MTRVLLFVLALLIPAIAAADVYKWRDQSGRWHYGDEPRPGAARVELPPVQVYRSPQTPPAFAQPARQQDRGEAALSYARVDIISPAPEATVRNATGEIGVTVALEPSLRPGHAIRLLLDGAPVAAPAGSTAFAVADVARGAHTVAAEVLDARGDVIARAGPQPFHVHRTSQLD
jgi:hypothetical protein